MAEVNDVLLDGFGRVEESVGSVLEGLGTDDLAWRPAGSGNSVGWLVWHLTRVVDDHLADAFDVDQVVDAHAERLGLSLPATDTGYGHSSEEVDAVRFANPSALGDYHRAVMEQARPLLAEVSGLDRVVDDRWDPPVTLGVRLVSVLDDAIKHVGQAEYVRGMLPDGA